MGSSIVHGLILTAATILGIYNHDAFYLAVVAIVALTVIVMNVVEIRDKICYGG